jgi:hypothetical protein
VELVFIIFFVIFYDAPFFIAEIFSRFWSEFSIFLCNSTFLLSLSFFLLLLFSSSMVFFFLKIGAPAVSGPHATGGVCAYIFISGKDTLAIIGAEYIPNFKSFLFRISTALLLFLISSFFSSSVFIFLYLNFPFNFSYNSNLRERKNRNY